LILLSPGGVAAWLRSSPRRGSTHAPFDPQDCG
jgi:hypothetical protein